MHPTSRRHNDFESDTQVEVIIAPNAGACFGVVRAIKVGKKAIEKALASNEPIYSLGPLVHDPLVVTELSEKGLKIIGAPSEANRGTVVLRSHGIPEPEEALLKKKKIQIADATCPLVKKPQRIAKGLGVRGYFLIVVGDPNHPEVKGVLSYFAKPDFLVTYSAEKVSEIPETVKRVGILAQTTIENRVFDSVVEAAKKRFQEVLQFNTICDATSIRQTEAETLSKKADVMVVVGGRNSSNTAKLVKICKANKTATYHIETASELQADWFRNKTKIGITGGAATPEEYVNFVGEEVSHLIHQSLNGH